ncbi:MAG TPA: hypothetical protein VMU17_07505, partial [Elusimicrobiota bacterium]|nr:hypothetical protein [Elusimicrobiota bacterium]
TDRLLDCWRAAPPRRVEISLHGISDATFEGVTQVPGSLRACQAGIAKLLEARIRVTLKAVALTLNRHEILAIKRYARSLGPLTDFRLGEDLRDDLALSGSPFRFQLTDAELHAVESQDPELASARELGHASRVQSGAAAGCGGGRQTFHIDAYGRLQLCSNNRRGSYDLRKGSFVDGFYKAMPGMPCPRRAAANVQIVQAVGEAR